MFCPFGFTFREQLSRGPRSPPRLEEAASILPERSVDSDAVRRRLSH
jgi:hypothetical protein